MIPYYYPRVIERVSTALLDAFNDIKINRYNEDGDVIKIIDVPLIFHYNKNFAEYIMNTSRNKESRHTAPIMGLRWNGLVRDSNRVTQQKKIRTIFNADTGTYLRDRRPSAWKLNFSLNVYTENPIDLLQIIENVVTYFDPTLTISIKEFEKVNIERDIIVTLNDPQLEILDEVSREEKQTYSIDIPLVAQVVLYPPVSSAEIIKFIRQDIAIDNRNIGEIQNDGIYPSTIAEYRALHYTEILNNGVTVENGNIDDSVNVTKIIDDSDNFYRIVLDVNSKSIIPLKTLLARSSIVYVEIQITERFNSFKTGISIGDSNNNESIMKKSENNPYFVAKYAYTFEKYLNKDTTLNVYYDRSNATEGNAVISISWK